MNPRHTYRIALLFTVVGLCSLGVSPLTRAAEDARPPARPNVRAARAEAEVRKVLARHFEGVAKADRALLAAAWDVPNAHLKYVDRDGSGAEVVRAEPIEQAFARWTESPAPDSKGEVRHVELLGGRVALARVEFNWRGTIYQESLTLLKAGREWRIVNKTYAVASDDEGSGFGY